jgi:general stress protein 26
MNTIVENTPIQFLQQKIQKIRSALFFSQHNDVIKMPVCIITVLKADNEGNLWFFVKRPSQSLEAFEKEFPARLDFFKKKINYFLQVTGKAFIIQDTDVFMNDWADISDASKEGILNELVLVKVKMMSVDYFDNAPAENKYWWDAITQKIMRWFLTDRLGYRPYGVKPKHLSARFTA